MSSAEWSEDDLKAHLAKNGYTPAWAENITGNIGVNGGGCNFMHNTWPGGLNLPPLRASTPKLDLWRRGQHQRRAVAALFAWATGGKRRIGCLAQVDGRKRHGAWQ